MKSIRARRKKPGAGSFPRLLIRCIILVVVLRLHPLSAFGQERCNCPQQSKVGKGTLYISWGYNREIFSKSDLHFRDPDNSVNEVTSYVQSYDFTLYDVTAHDRGRINDIFEVPLTIPQYNYRLGYYFNNASDLGVELNFDHTKYIMDNGQSVHVKGTIHGTYYDQEMVVDPDTFLMFEHSDGANFLMANLMKRFNLTVSANKKLWLGAVVKAGAGPVIPRTDVTIFGERLNNKFHIAGFCAGVEAGLRFDFFKYAFLEYTGKGVYSDYRNVLVLGTGKAHHHFWTLENILTFGAQVPL